MKKIFAAALALAFMLIMWIPTPLYAANGPTFSVGFNITAQRGGTITVPVTVSNNPGFTAVGLILTYDPDVLQITGVTAPVADMPLNSQFELTSVPGTQWIHFINSGLADWAGNGVVANIVFNIKPNAPTGTSPVSLAFTNLPDGRPGNIAGDILTGAATVSGSVNVTASAASDLTFSINSGIDAIRGETITVPIAVNNNTGFTATGLTVTYDPNVLIITDVSAPVAAMPLNAHFELNPHPRTPVSSTTQWIHLINTNLMDWSGNGTVVNMTFSVISDAAIGPSPITLAFTDIPSGIPGTADGEILRNAVAISGSVNIIEPSGNGGNNGPDDNGGNDNNDNNNSNNSNSNNNSNNSNSGNNNSGNSGGSGSQGSSGGSNNPNNSNSQSNHNSTNNPNSPQGQNNPNNYSNTVAANTNTNTVAADTGFIGNPYTSGNTGTGHVAGVSGPGRVSNFGRVPQTGIADISMAIFAVFAGIAVSASLWLYILLRRKYNRT